MLLNMVPTILMPTELTKVPVRGQERSAEDRKRLRC